MGKLKFKETQHERDDRKVRHARNAKRHDFERAELYADHDASVDPRPRKKQRTNADAKLEDANYENYLREAEDRAFRARLFDEMGADDSGRMDDLSDTFQSYYIPDRWASGHYATPKESPHMTDEEYSEYVREGMWKRTHAKEAEELERKRVERAERKARQEAKCRENKRLEAALRKDSEHRRLLRDEARKQAAFSAYSTRWANMSDQKHLSWAHIPWPSYEPPTGADAITLDSVRGFILSETASDITSKDHRQRLKEALLLWHPDRFEGRWLGRIEDAAERDRVRDAVGVIARLLNQLMEEFT
ncbi:hypothetical protein BKA62DRAFT_613532 [Auriculariales sp. MPI-PUGE-AT-0066]|nr:hypothetical protein BKA62DRAFT_613532 [Auriculariales sp. MPI-PUGE-AT-0066]